MLTGNEIRRRFIDFFVSHDHEAVPSAPLVPENDPTVLFNTAGMQPLTPYLLGQPHPTGSKRIVNAQKCLRTNDIDEVGDNTHLTFFEMLGNWSLGDYFKADAIKWSFAFLTDPDKGLGLDPKRLYVTVFAGDENAPRDNESYQVWSDIFVEHGMDPERRIFYMDAEANWWSPGDNGPCGPDSEMFYDITGTLCDGLTHEAFVAADDRQHVVEIWNDVFMEYEKRDGIVIGKLASQNVDTGSGLERITATVQGVDNVFQTDLFLPLLNEIESKAQHKDARAVRIIADHLRASVFLLSDGVTPANTDQGYILRRLLRRSIREADKIGLAPGSFAKIATNIIAQYQEAYPNLETKQNDIVNGITAEEEQFRSTLAKGLKEFDKYVTTIQQGPGERGSIEPEVIFTFITTHGFPREMLQDEADHRGLSITEADWEAVDTLLQDHQAKSRAGAEYKFKGGLADNSKKVVQYHTATHLLLAALQAVLGEHVHQAGSNITTERMRFDVTHPEKIDKITLDKIETWVNQCIRNGGVVTTETLSKEEAKHDSTIEGSFWDKYPDKVTVYTITGPDGTIYSRELCGGPHVTTLDEISGTFKIKKEESVAAGVRRIKAVLTST